MHEEHGTAPLETGAHAADLIRRPQIGYQDLASFDPERPELPDEVTEQVEIQIKYEGYIQKQLIQVEQMRKLENRLVPEGIDTRRSWPRRKRSKAPKGSSAQHRPGLPHLGGQPGGYFGAFDLSGEQKTGRITVSCETFCRGGTNSCGKG